MIKYVDFFIKHSFSKLHKEWLVIFCLSISLVLSTGMNYFFQATEKYKFNNLITWFSDFEITYDDIIVNDDIVPHINFSTYYNRNHDQIKQVLDTSILDIVHYSPYALFHLPYGIMSNKLFDDIYTLNYTGALPYTKALNATAIQWALFQNEFYESDRFNNYFKIIEGTYPHSQNEILVDYFFAQHMNLHLGDTTDIYMLLGIIYDSNPPFTNYKNFPVRNMTISGIYLPILDHYRIQIQEFNYHYTYNDLLENKTYSSLSEELERPAIFGNYNFSNLNILHPLQEAYNQIHEDQFYLQYLDEDYIISGYVIFYDRPSINLDRLFNEKTIIAQRARNMSLYLPSEVNFVDYMAYQLNVIYRDSRITFIIIQLLNLPVLIFSVLVSQNLVYTKGKLGLEELIMLRIRGVPIPIIKAQLYFSALIKGLICTIIGILGGFITFFIFQRWFGPLFFNIPNRGLSRYVTNVQIWSTLLMSVVINAISIYPKIRKIGQPEYAELAESVKAEEGGISYDESLFDESTPEDMKVLEALREKTLEASKRSDSKLKLLADKLGFHLQSQSPYKQYLEKEKIIIPPEVYLALLGGGLPLLVNLVLIIINSGPIPDVFIDINNTLVDNLYIYLGIVFLGIGLLVAGILRFFLIEHPIRLAQITTRISHIFDRKMYQLIGLELIRNRKWARIFIFLTIFSVLLITTNITFNSQYRYETIEQNFPIGADLQIEMLSHNMINKSQINEYEYNLTHLDFDTPQPLISSLSTCLIDDLAVYRYIRFNNTLSIQFPLYSIDLQQYLHIITEDKKVLPNPLFELELQKVMNYNTNPSTGTTGIVVTSDFLYRTRLEIGDMCNFTHHYFNSSNNNWNTYTIQGRILAELDFMPGLFLHEQSSAIIMDSNFLLPAETLLHGNRLITLVDLNNNLSYNASIINTYINPIISPLSIEIGYNLYNQEWNNIYAAKLELTAGTSGLYGIIFYDFIFVGIILAIELGFTILVIIRENSKFEGILQVRGLGKRGLMRIAIIEVLVLYILTLIFATAFGIFFGWSVNRTTQGIISHTRGSSYPQEAYIPLYFEFLRPFGVFMGIIGIIFTIVLIGYWIQLKHKTIIQHIEEI